MAQLSMSASVTSARPTATADLDRAVSELHEQARPFARLAPRAKARLLRSCIPRVLAVGAEWSARGLAAKGLPPDSLDEWLAGPLPTVRQLRLLADTLDRIAVAGRPPLGAGHRQRDDGRLEVSLFPGSALDRTLYPGVSAHARLQPGLDADQARARQASLYSRTDASGGVCLVLGAGNVSSIPALDVLSKLFEDGLVCLLKVNPVNEYVGPLLEQALAPLVAAGYLRIVYGGAEQGQHLVGHPGIDAVHLTGSAGTHDALVWGPPGPEQDRRRTAGDPVLRLPITSELGNITPVVVVPHQYRPDELSFQARYLATMVANNASFNCIAAKVLVTANGWPQREEFLDLLTGFLGRIPLQRAYYPGATERYATLTHGRDLQTLGTARQGELPWTLIRGVDAGNVEDPLFRTEPFCPVLTETSVGSTDPVDFLDAAREFLDDTLWGTLSAAFVVSPVLERDPAVAEALDRAITELRYGTVAVNHWPALGYTLITPPWGGHPSATLADVQSGLGWVHNTYLLEGVEKVVLRGPVRTRPVPPWFADQPAKGGAGPTLIRFEAEPGWRKLPGMVRRLR